MENTITKFISKWVGKIAGKENEQFYEAFFAKMTKADFELYMTNLKETGIRVTVPNNGNSWLSVEKNLGVAEELGCKIFQHITYTDPDGYDYTPDIKYAVVLGPAKRACQTLSHAVSVTLNNDKKDALTGQVTSANGAAKLSGPETHVLQGMGLQKVSIEFMKDRGGDLGTGRALAAYIDRDGTVSREQLNEHETGVESTKTLKAFYNAAQLEIDLL